MLSAFDNLQLQTHSVVDFIVLQCNVILVDGVPFLDTKLFGPRPQLCRRQFLEIPNGVVFVAFDAHLFAETVVQNYFNHIDDDDAGGGDAIIADAAAITVLLL